MNIFGLFSKSPKVVDDVFDKDDGLLVKAGGFIDDLHQTEPERVRAYNNFFGETLKENTERSRTRRQVAVDWIHMQIKLIWITVVAVFLDHLASLLNAYDTMALTKAMMAITFSGLVWSITAGIGAFFFGTHMLRSNKD